MKCKKKSSSTIEGHEKFPDTGILILTVLPARVQDEGFLLTSHSLSNPTPQCGLLPLKYQEGKAGGLQHKCQTVRGETVFGTVRMRCESQSQSEIYLKVQ